MTTVATIFDDLEQARRDVNTAAKELPYENPPSTDFGRHRIEVYEEALARWWEVFGTATHYALAEYRHVTDGGIPKT